MRPAACLLVAALVWAATLDADTVLAPPTGTAMAQSVGLSPTAAPSFSPTTVETPAAASSPVSASPPATPASPLTELPASPASPAVESPVPPSGPLAMESPTSDSAPESTGSPAESPEAASASASTGAPALPSSPVPAESPAPPVGPAPTEAQAGPTSGASEGETAASPSRKKALGHPEAKTQAQGVQGVADAVESGTAEVDAELGSLSGGPLTLALTLAARQGRLLRILLDPADPGARVQGPLLADISPTARVRWLGGLRTARRWMDISGIGQRSWRSGGRPSARPSRSAPEHFERAWAVADLHLPRAQNLFEQLQSLPDPREETPHYVRRAGGAAP